MNYRQQALALGSLLIVGGASVLTYVVLQVQAATSLGQDLVRGSIVAFLGLGLVLVGTMTMFAAPQTLIASEIVGDVLSPSAENMAVIVSSFRSSTRGVHMPKVILGRESEVFLVISKDGAPEISEAENDGNEGELNWSPTRKVLQPTGIGLMKAYEKVLKRDFLGLDASQLARLLSKAIVPELQLGSGFSMKELSSGKLEATWTKPTVIHTCIGADSTRFPELCCLCSSIACALAKATGKPVWVEGSKMGEASLTVIATYRVLGD